MLFVSFRLFNWAINFYSFFHNCNKNFNQDLVYPAPRDPPVDRIPALRLFPDRPFSERIFPELAFPDQFIETSFPEFIEM